MTARWVAGAYLLLVVAVFVFAEVSGSGRADASMGHIWVFLVTAPTSLLLWALGDLGPGGTRAVLAAAGLFQAVVLYAIVRALTKKSPARSE